MRLLPAAIPEFPVFNASFKPSRPPDGDDPCKWPHRPYRPRAS
jgi:hypothetical protein